MLEVKDNFYDIFESGEIIGSKWKEEKSILKENVIKGSACEFQQGV